MVRALPAVVGPLIITVIAVEVAGRAHVMDERAAAGVLGVAGIRGGRTVAARLDKRRVKVAIAAHDVSDNLAAGEHLDIAGGQGL